jgi:Leucine-rich repeat (LRR) protein
LHELKTLNISKNRLSRLNPNIQYLDKLEMLDASNNQISSIPREIDALLALKDINLSHNRLEGYPGQVYKLQNLERLDLSYNDFDSIPVETGNLELLKETGEWEVGIGMLTKLKYLDFRRCRLKEWSTQLEKLGVLQDLFLSDNDIAEIPSDISELKMLRVFHISGNLIRSLPNELYFLPLEEFRAQSNELSDLPECSNAEEINSPNMRYLDISNNSLETLDRRLSIFGKLKTLMAQHNHLKVLSGDCFATMSSLTYVDLSHNQLSEISASLGNAVHLTHCDLSYNNLTEVPSCFFRCSRLKILKLDHNMIVEVSGRVLGMINDLERLEMQHNLIQGALPSLLFAIKKLVYVDMTHNHITEIPSDLGHWTKLIHLNLAYNSISYLPDTLGELTDLTLLKLDHNCLLELPKTFARLTKLEHLSLNSNRLYANPHILELLPQLHYIDLSWNVEIPPHLLKLPSDSETSPNSTAQTNQPYLPFQRKSQQMLPVEKEQYNKRIGDLTKRIQELAEKVDGINRSMKQQEQDFIGNKQINEQNFEVILSWIKRLRQHFKFQRVNAHELKDSSAQRLKSQIDPMSFNATLEDVLVNLQKYKSNLRDRVYFSHLALKQNRIPRWYSNFLDFVNEHDDRAPNMEALLTENHAADVLNEVFLGLDVYSVLEEICDVLHELNLLALIEELDNDLYRLDNVSINDEKTSESDYTSSSASVDGRGNLSSTIESEHRNFISYSNEKVSRNRQLSIQSDDSNNSMPRGRMTSISENEGVHDNAETFESGSFLTSATPEKKNHMIAVRAAIGQVSSYDEVDSDLKKNVTPDGISPSDKRERRSFLAGITSSPGTESPNSTASETTNQAATKTSNMFFSFTSSTKANKKQDRSEQAPQTATATVEKRVPKAELKIESLGVNIQTNDLPKVLYLMKHFIDIEVLMSCRYSQGKAVAVNQHAKSSFNRVLSGFGMTQHFWKELPSMNINFHCLQQTDKQELKDYLSPSYTLVRENPFGNSLFSLYFEANQVLAKGLITALDCLTRGIRSMERENEEKISCIDLANRDHFYQFHFPDEDEIREREKLQEKKNSNEERKRRSSLDFSIGTPANASAVKEEETHAYDPNITEVECIEDFGDLLRDVYNALSQDKKISDKKDKQLSLKDRYKKNVQNFLVAFEDSGGLGEMKDVFENDFKISTVNPSASRKTSLSMAAGDDESSFPSEGIPSPSRRPSYIMKRSSSNLQESFNTRRSSQANLRRKLAAWLEVEDAVVSNPTRREPLLGKDRALGRNIIDWLVDFRKLMSGWLIQCTENNAMILSLRGIDVYNYDTEFLRNFHILRDPSDPISQRMMAFKKSPLEDDNEIVPRGMPCYITSYLLGLTRRYMTQRARACQIFGYYSEAMRAFDAAISLHSEHLPQEFFVNYVKVCITNGHYFRAQTLMERIIRRFIMPKYPEIKEQNRKKIAGKMARIQLAQSLMGRTKHVDDNDHHDQDEDELFTDVQMLPVEREIAILTRFVNSQTQRLQRMGIQEEEVVKKTLCPHAFLDTKDEVDMDEQEHRNYFAKPPELRYGRKANIKEINALRLQEDTVVKQAHLEEELRWDALRKCKDAQFRSRIALDAEDLLESFGITMSASTKS